jgi:hypothetical protein
MKRLALQERCGAVINGRTGFARWWSVDSGLAPEDILRRVLFDQLQIGFPRILSASRLATLKASHHQGK